MYCPDDQIVKTLDSMGEEMNAIEGEIVDLTLLLKSTGYYDIRQMSYYERKRLFERLNDIQEKLAGQEYL
jgi:hypothetical protein